MTPGARDRLESALAAFALVAFVVVLVCGPLSEQTMTERGFASTLLLAALLLVLFATGRLAFALLATALPFALIVVAGALKLRYMGTPLLAPDLEYFINRETFEVIRRYPALLAAFATAAIAVPALLAAAFVASRKRPFAGFTPAVRRSLRAAGVLAAGSVLVAALAPRGPFAMVYGKPMWARMNDRSFVTDFFTSFHDTQAHRPVLPANIDTSIDWRRAGPDGAATRRPDIVAVLEESTFDPSILKPCTIPACRPAMFRPDARTRAHGLLEVHTFGGGTWTSEFAFLTGLPDTLFGNAGLYAPYNLAPRVAHTLPKTLAAAGYRSIAIYPLSGDFMNARNAYADYGFDAFYDGTQYGLGWKSTDADLLRVFERILAAEKAAHPGVPLFVFMLTLHQHGPHMTPLAELPPPFDQPLFTGAFTPPDLDAWLNLNLGNYLERLHESDAMLAQLAHLLFGGGGPAVLVQFGDHQPSFDGAIYAIPKRLPADANGTDPGRVTYYRIDANFAAPAARSYPVLDIALLGSLVLDVAGIPQGSYFQANSLLRERCGGHYVDCPRHGIVASYHAYVFNRLDDLAP